MRNVTRRNQGTDAVNEILDASSSFSGVDRNQTLNGKSENDHQESNQNGHNSTTLVNDTKIITLEGVVIRVIAHEI